MKRLFDKYKKHFDLKCFFAILIACLSVFLLFVNQTLFPSKTFFDNFSARNNSVFQTSQTLTYDSNENYDKIEIPAKYFCSYYNKKSLADDNNIYCYIVPKENSNSYCDPWTNQRYDALYIYDRRMYLDVGEYTVDYSDNSKFHFDTIANSTAATLEQMEADFKSAIALNFTTPPELVPKGKTYQEGHIFYNNKEYVVTQINTNAFDESYATHIHCNLVFPSTIKSIGDLAFQEANGGSTHYTENAARLWFHERNLPTKVDPSQYYTEGLHEIGNKAFYKAGIYGRVLEKSSSKQSSLYFPSTLERIGDSAFSCSKNDSSSSYDRDTIHFDEINFTRAKNLKKIGERAFFAIKNLRAIYGIEDTSLQEIGKSAFCPCNTTNLSTLKLPATLKVVGEHAFYKVSDLKTPGIVINNLDLSNIPWTNLNNWNSNNKVYFQLGQWFSDKTLFNLRCYLYLPKITEPSQAKNAKGLNFIHSEIDSTTPMCDIVFNNNVDEFKKYFNDFQKDFIKFSNMDSFKPQQCNFFFKYDNIYKSPTELDDFSTSLYSFLNSFCVHSTTHTYNTLPLQSSSTCIDIKQQDNYQILQGDIVQYDFIIADTTSYHPELDYYGISVKPIDIQVTYQGDYKDVNPYAYFNFNFLQTNHQIFTKSNILPGNYLFEGNISFTINDKCFGFNVSQVQINVKFNITVSNMITLNPSEQIIINYIPDSIASHDIWVNSPIYDHSLSQIKWVLCDAQYQPIEHDDEFLRLSSTTTLINQHLTVFTIPKFDFKPSSSLIYYLFAYSINNSEISNYLKIIVIFDNVKMVITPSSTYINENLSTFQATGVIENIGYLVKYFPITWDIFDDDGTKVTNKFIFSKNPTLSSETINVSCTDVQWLMQNVHLSISAYANKALFAYADIYVTNKYPVINGKNTQISNKFGTNGYSSNWSVLYDNVFLPFDTYQITVKPFQSTIAPKIKIIKNTETLNFDIWTDPSNPIGQFFFQLIIDVTIPGVPELCFTCESPIVTLIVSQANCELKDGSENFSISPFIEKVDSQPWRPYVNDEFYNSTRLYAVEVIKGNSYLKCSIDDFGYLSLLYTSQIYDSSIFLIRIICSIFLPNYAYTTKIYSPTISINLIQPTSFAAVSSRSSTNLYSLCGRSGQTSPFITQLTRQAFNIYDIVNVDYSIISKSSSLFSLDKNDCVTWNDSGIPNEYRFIVSAKVTLKRKNNSSDFFVIEIFSPIYKLYINTFYISKNTFVVDPTKKGKITNKIYFKKIGSDVDIIDCNFDNPNFTYNKIDGCIYVDKMLSEDSNFYDKNNFVLASFTLSYDGNIYQYECYLYFNTNSFIIIFLTYFSIFIALPLTLIGFVTFFIHLANKRRKLLLQKKARISKMGK